MYMVFHGDISEALPPVSYMFRYITGRSRLEMIACADY